MKKKMEKQQLNLQKQQKEIQEQLNNIEPEKIKEQVEKAMISAKKSIDKAKKELQTIQHFTNALQQDGLIDKSKTRKIDIINNELYIDDIKQLKEMSDKYRQYFPAADYHIILKNDDTEI